MTHTLLTVGLLCLYGLSAPAVSQWHIRYDGDVPAPTAENRATIARLDILLPHYRHNRSIRLHFDFHNRDRQQAEIRWQALKRQLPALAGLDYRVYNRPDPDILHIELFQEAAAGCPARLTVKDPALPLGKGGFTVDGMSTLSLSARGTIRIRRQDTPYIALAYDPEEQSYTELQERLDTAFTPLAVREHLLIGLQRLHDKNSKQAEEQLRRRLQKSAEAGKAMSLSPVPAETVPTKTEEDTKEWCIIKIYRL
ncbi:hypothetical protein [uncultured Cardiobacterium sp.]|uniref:hypothetical protein n=1 Tax=uncultured Cardiobacterium sp. TaxID=417619 RepID=UPI002619E216|nr:hypothetical protein [uncultured Cardiobacterium sp.]